MDHVSSNNVVVSPKVYPAKKNCRSQKLHLDPISFTLLRKCEAKFQSQARLWSSSSSKTAASNSKILLTTDIVGKKNFKIFQVPAPLSTKNSKFQTSSSSVENPIRKTHHQVLSKGASSWGKKETGAVQLQNQSLSLPPPPKKTQE